MTRYLITSINVFKKIYLKKKMYVSITFVQTSMVNLIYDTISNQGALAVFCLFVVFSGKARKTYVGA